jgi:hypothetical protein
MKPSRLLIALLAMLATICPAWAQVPGWSYSPLPGEGDRAALGCDRDATAQNYACLAVRCEDDFSVGVHIHTSRLNDAGTWEMTADREVVRIGALPDAGPYGARFPAEDAAWLLDRLRHGTFIYLSHAEDVGQKVRFISLDGSYAAIHAALQWCAPRSSGEQPVPSGSGTADQMAP